MHQTSLYFLLIILISINNLTKFNYKYITKTSFFSLSRRNKYNKYICSNKKGSKKSLNCMRFVLLVYHVSVRTREVENRLLATCLKEGLFVILHIANSLVVKSGVNKKGIFPFKLSL